MHRDIRLPDLATTADNALRALGLGKTFTLDEFHARLEDHIGRPIHVEGHDWSALSHHGYWVSGVEAEYVFYDTSGGPYRAGVNFGHELAHVLMHRGDGSTKADLIDQVAALMPSLKTDDVSAVMARTTFEAPREKEAEAVATIMMQRAIAWTITPRSSDIEPDVLRRIAATLEGRRPR